MDLETKKAASGEAAFSVGFMVELNGIEPSTS
jgi:hypothetical protein